MKREHEHKTDLEETIHYLTVLRGCDTCFQHEIRIAIDHALFILRVIQKDSAYHK